jgi:hypothetical protein
MEDKNISISPEQRQRLEQALIALVGVVLSIVLSLVTQYIGGGDAIETLGTTHFTNLAVTNNASIGGDLTVTGAQTFTGAPTFTADITANADLTIDDTLAIDDTTLSIVTTTHTLTPTASLYLVTPTVTNTTVTLATGSAATGDYLWLTNLSPTYTVTIADTGATAGGSTRALADNDVIGFIYTGNEWAEAFFSDNS